MSDQVGRNEPCPCGSGRKYKNCCYRRNAEAAGARRRTYPDAEWQRMRRTEGEVIEAIAAFAHRRFNEGLFERAWREFSSGSTIPEAPLAESIFIPWLVFNWLPSPAGKSKVRHERGQEPLALAYLAEHGSELDEYRKAFIVAACNEPFSFFVVTAAEPNRSLSLRDLLLEREVTVKELQASELLKRGDIIYARTISLAGQSILLGVAPIPLPPEMHAPLLDLRLELKKSKRTLGRLDPAWLRSQDGSLRSYYFEAAEHAMNPPPPVLQNTDGDPLAPIRLIYKLHCLPELAVDKLKTLVLPEFQGEILDGAKFDRSGNILRVSLTWQKRGNRVNVGWENTSLGNIEIRRGAVEVEVNSEKRAEKIRREIQRRLGDDCSFQKEERHSIEDLLRQNNREPGSGKQRAPEIGSMPPEIRAAIGEQMRAHWDAWIDIPVPALKNKTPREAAATPEGRERLEALLMEFESRSESGIQPELRPNVAELRRKLGLPTSPHYS
jgi:hypothetical protein